MNFEQLKAEAIRKAWVAEIGQKAFELLQHRINYDDGSLIVIGEYDLLKETREILGDKLQETDKFKFDGRNLYLVALNGLEDNHGWIRIEADGSNLPNSDEWLEVFQKESQSIYKAFRFKNEWRIEGGGTLFNVTHYKPIEKSNPPIF